MIFLTVGTQFPFDRLVMALDRIAGQKGLDEKIFAQIGRSSYRPVNFSAVSYLDKNLFDEYIRCCSAVISHAGMGTIIMASEYEKPMLVMPRLSKYKEVVNDHQIAIADKFEHLGCVLAAYDTKDLPEKIKALKHFVPQKRKTEVQTVTKRISGFLNEIT